MNRRWRSWRLEMAAVVCCAICTPCCAKQSANAATTSEGGAFRVAGIVVNSKTGELLAQARILLVSTKDARDAVSMVTQEDGRFAFSGLSSGKYSLQGARRGYLPAAYEQHEQYSTAIVTGAGFDTQNLTLRLVPMAAITGTVIDENGEGVRQAQVRLYGESHRGGTTRVIFLRSEMTDDQGTFEFVPIGPGKYYASASATPWYAMRFPTSAAMNSGNASANADRSLDAVYPTTFYGGATDSDGAEPIEVKAADHAQIEIHLSPVPGLHLVLNVGGDAQHGYRIPEFQTRMFGTLEGQFAGIQSWQSSSSPGVVELAGLAPGHYSMRMAENGSGELTQEAEVELKQNGQNLSEWQGEALGSVKLRVKMPKGETLPKQTTIGLQDQRNRTMAYSRVDQNGEAKSQGLSAGKYGIRVFATGAAYAVTKMTSAETQVSAPQFSLKAGESQEWTVELAAAKTTIEGFVKRGGKAASGVMVVLIPSDPETHQDLFRRDQSDLDGSFVLRGVIPGSYSVVAIEDAWGFDWSQPTLLARYAQHGQAVTIGELMQGTVSLLDPVEVQAR
ncbi:MAG TPA: carboxypeptidase-like regulatory domain-containing protein [Candidatus Methylomirabilis sp.]|nr:carboxypeptidase-like regulatory domain-containing protein [Candidatus Methylomirabilis sp.]